uniref:Uncharacterized protein n=1 Tax=Rhizophora mucronata TaxID=61149 RepID=A0A2P2PDU5_RHIMU
MSQFSFSCYAVLFCSSQFQGKYVIFS